MSTVSKVGVQSTQPTYQQPNNGVKTSGSSSGNTFTFKGVYSDGNRNCVVVLQATNNCASVGTPVPPNSGVNGTKDGGIFPSGSTGTWLTLTTGSGDLNNWTVRARTDKDAAGTGVTFSGGTGGGGVL